MQQLCDNIGSGAFKPDVVDRQNVGVVESGGGAGFLLEAPQMIGIITGGWADELQGNVASQAFVSRAKDLAHPARANFFEDPIMPDPLPNHPSLAKRTPLHGMLGSKRESVKSRLQAGFDRPRRPPTGGNDLWLGRAIIWVRLHPYRGNPVISSEGESCAIQSSLKKNF